MAGSLAARFSSTNTNQNVCTPGEKVSFAFTSPPKVAAQVLVTVRQSVTFLNGRGAINNEPIGGFRGRISGGQFKVESVLGAPLPAQPDPVVIEVAASFAAGAPKLFAHVPEPELVRTHTLSLRIEGTIDGKRQFAEGSAPIHLEYPLAMVIPQGGAQSDASLNFVRAWAEQWRGHKPSFRTTHGVPLVRLTRAIRPSDYDPFIQAVTAAATASKSGVVALAVGHGDDGDTRSVAWCNLVPEDFSPETEIANYRLDIDDQTLVFGKTPGSIPGASERVKLDALDRLGDALSGTPIRRLLLHTCNAGSNADFMQMLADRVRVPVMAHTEFIAYQGFIGQSIDAFYEPDTPRRPDSLHFWPIRRVGQLARPGAPPRRLGP
jgi:hypothetical protein